MNLIDLKSSFASSLVSHIAQELISKKFGIDTNLDLSSFVVTDKDDSVVLSIAGSVEITKDNIAKLVGTIMKGGLK